MRPILRITVIATVLSCSNTPSGRLEVERDTLSLYGKEYSFVPIRIVRSTVDSIARGATLAARDTSVVRTSGNAVACLREDTTDVEVRLQRLTATFVVACRFAAHIAGETFIELEPHAEPRSLAARLVFASGDSETASPIGARSSDTSVAVVRNGSIVPVAIGFAGLRVDYGGIMVRATVHVRRTVFNAVVLLKPSESRRWELDKGRYSVTVKVNSRQDRNALNMETEGLNCSRDPRDEDTIHCVAGEPGQVTLLNRSPFTSAGAARAEVQILQVP